MAANSNPFIIKNGLAVGNTTSTRFVIDNAGKWVGDPTDLIGPSGYSGISGTSGASGTSGISGASGTSGQSGYSGISGASGASGYSGYSGLSGYSLKPWTRKTSNHSAITNERIIADTSNGSFTITLPGSPTIGDYLVVTDGNDFSVTNCIIGRNGSTIDGYSDDVSLDLKGCTFEFIYDGTTWEVTATTGARGDSGTSGVMGYSGVSGYSGATGDVTPTAISYTNLILTGY